MRTAGDEYIDQWYARHPWAICNRRVAQTLAELEAHYGCRCGSVKGRRFAPGEAR